MIFPYNVDVGMQRLPWANWALIAATVIVGLPSWTNFESYYVDADAGFLYLGRDDEFAWYQLIGNLFGHASPGHLLGNMWMLFLYGNAVNAKIGHLLYIPLYLAIGVGESLIWLWFGDGQLTIGASGAVMGIVGAFVVWYPRNNVSIFYWLFFIKVGTWSISAYVVIAFYVVLDLVGMLGGGGVVNHLAHFAGAALGFGAMMIAAATGLIETEMGEQSLLDMMRGRNARSHRDRYGTYTPPKADRPTRPSGGNPRPAGPPPRLGGSRPRRF